MVAKIKTGKSLNGALNYNELKVSKGLAVLIEAQGFQKDAGDLSHYDKLARLTDLADRNQRVMTNCLHVSLNFDISEKLDDSTLVEIVNDYMDGIGFGNQPYLVYKHHDAGHPHVHVVSTNIDAQGNRISLHNLGKFQSEIARRSIEEKYGLIKAEGKKISAGERIKPEPIIYGTTNTKRALSNLINEVSRTYRFTSLAEFNALLSGFNVVADRGTKTSLMYQKNGLRYWITDSAGKKLGVPVKASSLYGKPTIGSLEKHFQLSQALRKPLKEQVQAQLNQAVRNSTSMTCFEKNLAKSGIDLIRRVNADGRLYGLTLVDHRRKVVFNGSDIGKSYSAANLITAFQYKVSGRKEPEPFQKITIPKANVSTNPPHQPGDNLLQELLTADQQGGVPAELLQRKRKKRKRQNL